MDWLTFISKIAEALVWPVTAVVLVLLLRKEVGALVPMLKRLKAGPLEAEFNREVKKLRAEAEKRLPTPATTAFPSPRKQQLLQLAEINPSSAIIEAWQGIEFTAQRLAEEKGLLEQRSATSSLAVLRAIDKANVLNSDEIALLHELRSLRNRAIHVPDFSPPPEAVLNYIEIADKLQSSLERGLREAKDQTAKQ